MHGRSATPRRETLFPRALRTAARISLFSAMMLGWSGLSAPSAWAATTAGTVINNTATAAFSDANSNSFNTTSNTITATVQNAPTMSVTAPVNQNVTPAEIVVDTFTLTNTGNNSGNFQLASDATFGGTASSTTLKGYVYGTNCTIAVPCNLATLNNGSNLNAAGNAVAAGGNTTVGVEYQVSASAATNQTVQTTLSANVTYAALTGAQAETSANASAGSPPTDTAQTDARLDVQAAVTNPGSSGANITWTITANNGGGYAAQGLAAAKTVLGAASNGVAIFIPMPSYNSTYLQLAATPSAPTLSGASSGATAAVYYNATACASSPTSGWSTTYSASAKCLAVYVSGGSANSELPSATGGSSGAGSVSTAQITFTFSTNQPSGTGSGNNNSVTVIASSAVGGNSWITGAVPIVGQGLAVGASQDAATASLLNTIQANNTASSGTTPPGGASNQIGSHAFLSSIVNNGPFNNPDATGWYPGAGSSASADIAHDFEAYSPPCTSNGNTSVNGQSCTVAANIILVNTVKNEGNATDTIQLSATAPAGWTVQLYNSSNCTGFSGAGCTQGSQITAQSSAGGNVNGNVSIASQASLTYEVVLNATGNSATPFNYYNAQITAAGNSGSGTGADSNATFDTLIPGGVVKLTNSLSVVSGNCPAGMSPSNTGVCPGGTLQFSVGYANVIPAACVSANQGTEPGFAYNALYTNTGSLVITDDGQANPSGASGANNWVTYTNGIQAAASDTTSSTVFTYYTSGGSTTSSFPGPAKVTAQIGGASYQLAPGASGTVSFNVIVK